MKNKWPKLFALALVLALVMVASSHPRPASALSSGVVISQVYGGGGNTGADSKSDFIELFNRGNSPVNLNGWSVQYASTTGTTWQKTDLTNVTLQPGQYYLIKEADGSGAVPPITNQDVTGTIPMSGSNAKVALVSSTTLITAGTSCPTTDIVDFLGFGTTTNCSETAPTANLSNTTAALRNGNGCTETDNNSLDFTIVSQPFTPRNTATTFNVCGGDAAPSVTSTTPADNATNVAATTNIDITFSETVTITGTIAVNGSSSGLQNLTPTGGPTTFTLDPSDFTAGEVVTVTVLGTQIADQDATDPPDNMAADYVFDFTILVPASVCGDPATLISAVQGNGISSPLDGNTVTIEAIVVGDFQFDASVPNSELNGYFLQEEDNDVDADPNTSEGIFVFEGSNPSTPAVSVGDKVRVTGKVDEFEIVNSNPALESPDKLTELVGPLTVEVCSTGNTMPTAATINLPVGSVSDFERYEGMAVFFPQELTVTETFTLGRFGEVRLAADGRLWIPTHEAEPGAPAAAVEAANILRSFVLDDGFTTQNPDPVRYPEPGGLDATNTLRGGDTTTGLNGVMHYLDTSSTDGYRVHPTETVVWDHDNPRPTDAPVISGTLKIVGSNTLNFFTTVDPGPDVCGPLENQDCRGADSDTEFTRQRNKLINALVEMNADVYGLVELENNADASPASDGTDPVLEDIVDGLNAALGAGTYDFIDTGVIGGDAIKVGLIYKTATATPVGSFSILDSSVDPNFDDSKNRPVLAQTFEDGNGERVTVAVAHLKSKGSNCGGAPDDQPDSGGGNCNGTRTAAAQAIVDWFATDPTGSGDTDFLLVGDLNSYAKEDPIDVLVNAGYVDLAADKITDPYSYVFDGEWGYLDYAMASPSLYPQVAGVAEWHINADEPIALDYNTEFKSAGQISGFYSSDPFRVSDHDPIIVGLDLTTPDTTPPDTTITNNPPNPSNSDSAFFQFTSSEPGNDFECQLDGLGWQECDGGQLTYGSLSDGSHTFEVRAIDAANNVDPTPASYTWVINTASPSAASIYVSTTKPGSVGPLSFGSDDILKWDGNAWSIWFDGSSAGLEPDRAKHNINAFYIPDTAGQAVIMSFGQNSSHIPDVDAKVDGMDLVRWDGSTFSLYFDGSDVDLTVKTQEKIDGLHILDGSASPINGGACTAYLLISTQGPGRVTNFDGTSLKFGGEDVLGFCATNLGASTAGFWHMVLDGSAKGMPRNSTSSLSLSDDGQTLYLTTQKTFNVDSAVGGHSMVYAYDFGTGTFSGPYFVAADHGLTKKVGGLHVDGDLIP